MFQRGAGIDDWFQFLSCEYRLAKLMKVAEPVLLKTGIHYGGSITWDCFQLLIVDNFYGIWPDATPSEKWTVKQINSLNWTWVKSGCYSDDGSSEAKMLMARYNRLLTMVQE